MNANRRLPARRGHRHASLDLRLHSESGLGRRASLTLAISQVLYLARHPPARGDRLEVVIRDRVLVLLPKKSLLDQDIDRRRKGVGVLALKQSHGPRVLPPAPNQLFFPLAFGKVGPDRQRHAHQNGHHAESDKERGHGVATIAIPQVRGTVDGFLT